jgi:hypothetical protein
VRKTGLAAVRDVAAQHQRLRLLVLHGSRSGGDEHAGSDWDFGYQGEEGRDAAGLHSALTCALGTDDVDLTDLDRASALLRFETARRGRCIYEDVPGAFEAFVLAATLFWCDAGPVIRRAHDAVLAGLPGP